MCIAISSLFSRPLSGCATSILISFRWGRPARKVPVRYLASNVAVLEEEFLARLRAGEDASAVLEECAQARADFGMTADASKEFIETHLHKVLWARISNSRYLEFVVAFLPSKFPIQITSKL